MHVLLTGFTPFGEDRENPSWEAARALDGMDCEGAHIVALQLPVAWSRAARAVVDAARADRPAAVVMAGLAAGRPGICVERVFLNLRSGRDEEGLQLREAAVSDGGPVAVAATLPVPEIVAELRSAGIPADASQTAGTYVCNATAYSVLDALPDVPAGFLHVPATPAMVARRQAQAAAEGRAAAALPSMAPETIRLALWIAVGVAVRAVGRAAPPPPG